MLNGILEKAKKYPPSYSNWLQLASDLSSKFYEVAIVGDNAKEKLKEINKVYIPNKLIVGATKESNLALLKNRFEENNTLIYICVNASCQLPTSSTNEAIKQILEK